VSTALGSTATTRTLLLPRRAASRVTTTSWDTLLAQAADTIAGSKVPSTRRSEASITSLYAQWMTAHHRPAQYTEEGILTFLQNMAGPKTAAGTALGGVANYGRFLHRQLRHTTGRSSVRIQAFIKALNRAGALVPKYQAPPIPRSALYAMQSRLPFREWVATWLCWKLASRANEVLRLTSSSFTHIAQGRIAVDWLQTTKAGKDRPFAIQNVSELRTSPARAREVAFLLSLRPDEHICPDLTTLKDPTAGLRRRVRQAGFQHAGAHSMKRGAAHHTLHLGVSRNVSLQALPRLLKHAEKVPMVPDNTIRYARVPTEWAQMGGTGDLSALL